MTDYINHMAPQIYAELLPLLEPKDVLALQRACKVMNENIRSAEYWNVLRLKYVIGSSGLKVEVAEGAYAKAFKTSFQKYNGCTLTEFVGKNKENFVLVGSKVYAVGRVAHKAKNATAVCEEEISVVAEELSQLVTDSPKKRRSRRGRIVRDDAVGPKKNDAPKNPNKSPKSPRKRRPFPESSSVATKLDFSTCGTKPLTRSIAAQKRKTETELEEAENKRHASELLVNLPDFIHEQILGYLPAQDLANATVASKTWLEIAEPHLWPEQVKEMHKSSYMMRDVPSETPIELDGPTSFRAAALGKRTRLLFAEERDPTQLFEKKLKIVLHDAPHTQPYTTQPAFERSPCLCHRKNKLCTSFDCITSSRRITGRRIESVAEAMMFKEAAKENNRLDSRVENFERQFKEKCKREEEERVRDDDGANPPPVV